MYDAESVLIILDMNLPCNGGVIVYLMYSELCESKANRCLVFLPCILIFQALVPVTIEVEVPFDLHRFIIGQKGVGIRKMMDEFEVSCFSAASFFELWRIG